MAGWRDLEGWVARQERRLVDRGAEQLLTGMVERPTGGRPTATGLAWFAVASAVHLSTVAVLVTGLWLTWWLPGIVKVLGVLVVLIGAWVSPVTRPRRLADRLRRADAPYLFGLLDEVAACIGGPVPHSVVVLDDFNAFASRGRRRVLGLGSALWMAAPRQARIALLGHELGHFAHRDLRSTAWGWRAELSLRRWYHLLDTRGGDADRIFVAPLMFPIRVVVSAVWWVLLRLGASSSRRREYLADVDAIRAGGSDGAREMLDVLLADELVGAAMTRAALDRSRPDPWSVLASALAGFDSRSRVNRRAAARTEKSRPDDSHPATWLRLELVDRLPREHAGVVLDRGRWAAIDAELASRMSASGQRLTEQVRASC